MNPLRSSARLGVAALAVFFLALAPALARAQALQQVPSDALVVVHVKNLKQTSQKMADLSQKLGLAQMQPAAADPLGSLKQQLNVQKGLDENRDAAFFFPNIEGQRRDDPEIVILVPVSNYKQFLENFAEPRQDGEFTVVELPDADEETYLANWGNYAAMGTSKEALSRKPDGLKPTGLAAKEVEQKDVVVFFNLKAARPRILPALTEGREKLISELEQRMKAAPGPGARADDADVDGEAETAAARPQQPQRRPGAAAQGQGAQGGADVQKFGPLMRTVINRWMDALEQVVRDADAATYGFEFADAGIKSTGLLEFAQGSNSAKRVAQFKSTDQPLLTGLPQTKYLFFGGTQLDPKVVQQLINDLAGPLEKDLEQLGEQGAPMRQFLSGLRSSFGNMEGYAFGAVTPAGMIGQESMLQQIYVSRGNAKAILAAQREVFNSQQAIMDLVMPENPMGQVKTTYVANAKTIDGVQLDLLQTEMNLAGGAQNPQQMQAQQMMQFMYGPGGLNAYTGAVGEDKVITAQGASDQLIKQLIASARANDTKLSQTKGVQATNAQLPKQRLAAFYFGIDQLALTAANYAKAFGMPINFQIPQDLAPLGMTVSTEGGNVVRADGFIPTQTVQSVVAGVMQVMMQMQGGQQPGGPGGL